MIDATLSIGAWWGPLYFGMEFVAYLIFRAVANWCAKNGEITRREAEIVPVVCAWTWPLSLPLLAIGSVVRWVRR